MENLLVDKILIESNRNEHFDLITGDLNAKSRNWFTNETTTAEGAHLDFLMTLYGLSQLITEPIHILEHSTSCIDLIFTIQPNISGTLEYILLFTKSSICRLFTSKSIFQLNIFPHTLVKSRIIIVLKLT